MRGKLERSHLCEGESARVPVGKIEGGAIYSLGERLRKENWKVVVQEQQLHQDYHDYR
jgi:hypothetical protein